MDSVNKAFEDLLVLNLCLKRIHWFSSGIPGKEMRKDGDQCASCGHWSLILNGFVEKSTFTMKSLVDACRVGRVDAVRSIVTVYEVDVNSSDPYGWTALHFAALHNQKETVNCLHVLGAMEMATKEGVLPSDMRPELFGKEPEPWQVPDTIEKLVDELLDYFYPCPVNNPSLLIGRMLRAVDKFGKEMLVSNFIFEEKHGIIIGARNGWVWSCRLWLELGVDVNIQDEYSLSILHETCYFGHTECTRLLLEAGANVNIKNRRERTPLFEACMMNKIECVRLLLNAGADVNARVADNWSVLHLSCLMGNPECVKLLLNAKVDVNARSTARGRTALDIAYSQERPICIRLLEAHLEREKDVEAPSAKRQKHV